MCYQLERIGARLAADTTLNAHLVYKGGFVLLKSFGRDRFTRDLDALGIDLEKAKIAEQRSFANVDSLILSHGLAPRKF